MTIVRIALYCGVCSAALAQAPGEPGWGARTLDGSLADLQGAREEGLIMPVPSLRQMLSTPRAFYPAVPAARPPTSSERVSLARLAHKAPRSARKAYQSGTKLFEAGKLAQAIGEFQRAIALDAGYAEPHCDLGVVYQWLKRYPEAEAEFRRAVELAPELTVLHSNLGWALLMQNKLQEAARYARGALAISYDNLQAHRLMAYVLAAAPETRMEALAHFEHALRLAGER